MSSKDTKRARWEKTAEVFARALEIPAAERQAWLGARTDLDEAVRREVSSLLEANEKAAGFLTPRRRRRWLRPPPSNVEN